MSDVRVIVQTVDQPEVLNSDEKKRLKFDSIMEKMDYCSDLIHADINRTCALKCVRKVWHWLEAQRPLPDYLYPIKEFITPIIRRYGADNYDGADDA